MNQRIAWLIDNNDRTKTKTDFAKRINISQPFLSQICSGSRVPSDRTVSDICREFRVNEKWLRTGEEPIRVDSTQREQLENFFSDVLLTAPDERSALIAALSTMPESFWPMAADFAKAYVENLPQTAAKEKED